MKAATRIALGSVILVGIAVALIALLASTDETTMTGSAYALTTPTPTPTPTLGPPCPGEPSPPGGTCPPCPTAHLQANDVGILSTCWPLLTLSPTPTPTPKPSCAAITDVSIQCTPAVSATPTPTPYVSPTPCPNVSPTNCDALPPIAGDADCDRNVDLEDVFNFLNDLAGVENAPCRAFANTKCDDALNPYDALLIVAYVASTGPSVPIWCPQIGASF